MSRVLLLLGITLLQACSVRNQVDVIAPESSVVVYANIEGYEDRFQNIYAKFSDYPVTCSENCYPLSPVIQCETPMQDCVYTGEKREVTTDTGFHVTWLGHASFSITTDQGQHFLFDPVFDQFDWPVNWAFRLSEGFFRNKPAPLPQGALNNLDAVMYSHIHYDHFNKHDIGKIGTKPAYLVPLGFASHFGQGGYNITEMAWYASKRIGNTTLHFVPAHHFSNRILVPYIYEDENKSLWGGWVLENNGKTVFFAGDTGYSPHFRDIAERFGNIDICLLPIASYFSEEAPKFYRKVHTTPEDALVAAKELGCKAMVPWGYGNASWRMGDITSHSALFRLLHMYDELNAEVPLYILNEGESIDF
ncbi:Zn-dependent hydrolase [Aestuariibacter sp. GS-14]|nr:MBL fold metallo-hydrolase [Aestuariibacter sp. GS-14]TPV57375.1 Zn-dependent hydrolase [Aestuariibacter sp. GS-14]